MTKRPSPAKTAAAIAAAIVMAAIGTWAYAEEAGSQSAMSTASEVAGTGGKVSAAGATVNVTGAAKSVAAMGATVSVTANVAEDVWVAGAEVTVNGTVGKDIAAAGSRITLRGKVGGDVWAAAAAIDADIVVGGDVKVAAAQVALGTATDIAGNLRAGGGAVAVGGHVAGESKIAGAKVLFDARADKTVSIEAQELTIGPNAVIAGDLVLVGATKATVDPAAKISGQTRQAASERWFFGPKVDPRPGQFGFSLFLAGTAILTGIGLMLLGRSSFDEAASTARHRPGSRFLIGLVVMILIPIVAVALAVTVIGIPLGIGLLLFLPFLFLIGHATAALGIADWVFNRAGTPRSIGRSILFLIVGAIGIAILGLIPVVGPIIVCITLLIGAGAFLGTLHGRLRRFMGAQMSPAGAA